MTLFDSPRLRRFAPGFVALLLAVGFVIFADPATAMSSSGSQGSISSGVVETNLKTAPNKPNQDTSPAAWEKSVTAKNASDYLAFSRWSSLSAVGIPDATFTNTQSMVAGTIAGLTKLAFVISGFVLEIIGVLVVFTVKLDLLNSAIPRVDANFQAVGSLFTRGGSSGAGVFGLSLAISLFLFSLALGWFKYRRDPARLIRSTIATVAIMFLFIMISRASVGNAELRKDIAGSSNPSVMESATSETEIDDWAPMSAGWLLYHTIDKVNDASAVVVNMISRVAKSADMTDPVSNGKSSCTAYIEAMHDIYDENAAGKKSIALAFDNLVIDLYFNMYKRAVFGNGVSSERAWCRLAEIDAKRASGDQIMIARKAGLYTPLVGTKTKNGLLVTKSGRWATASSFAGRDVIAEKDSSSESAANSLFGPRFQTSSAVNNATNFWAACVWSGDTIGVSGAWKDVVKASDMDPDWWEKNTIGGAVYNKFFEEIDLENTLSNEDCRKVVFGDKNNGKARYTFSNVDGPGIGFGDHVDQGKEFAYRDDTVGVAGFLSITVSPAHGFFANHTDRGDDRALEFYSFTHGQVSAASLLYALVGVVGLVIVIRFAVPLILATVIPELIAVLVALFLALLFLLLMVPIERGRSAAVKGLGLIATGIFTSAIFSVVLLFALSIYNVVAGIFVPEGANPVSTAILVALSAGVSFFIINIFLSKVLGIDTSSMKSVVSGSLDLATTALGDFGDRLFNRGGTKGSSGASDESGGGSGDGTSEAVLRPDDSVVPERREEGDKTIDEALKAAALRATSGSPATSVDNKDGVHADNSTKTQRQVEQEAQDSPDQGDHDSQGQGSSESDTTITIATQGGAKGLDGADVVDDTKDIDGADSVDGVTIADADLTDGNLLAPERLGTIFDEVTTDREFTTKEREALAGDLDLDYASYGEELDLAGIIIPGDISAPTREDLTERDVAQGISQLDFLRERADQESHDFDFTDLDQTYGLISVVGGGSEILTPEDLDLLTTEERKAWDDLDLNIFDPETFGREDGIDPSLWYARTSPEQGQEDNYVQDPLTGLYVPRSAVASGYPAAHEVNDEGLAIAGVRKDGETFALDTPQAPTFGLGEPLILAPTSDATPDDATPNEVSPEQIASLLEPLAQEGERHATIASAPGLPYAPTAQETVSTPAPFGLSTGAQGALVGLGDLEEAVQRLIPATPRSEEVKKNFLVVTERAEREIQETYALHETNTEKITKYREQAGQVVGAKEAKIYKENTEAFRSLTEKFGSVAETLSALAENRIETGVLETEFYKKALSSEGLTIGKPEVKESLSQTRALRREFEDVVETSIARNAEHLEHKIGEISQIVRQSAREIEKEIQFYGERVEDRISETFDQEKEDKYTRALYEFFAYGYRDPRV